MPAADVINLRISNEQKALIDHAAKSSNKSRSAFIIENALRCAEEVLLDRTRFTMNAEQWERFTAALDSKPSTEQVQALRKLFSAATPWNA